MGHSVWWWLAVALLTVLALSLRWIKRMDDIRRRPRRIWFRNRTPVCWQGWLLCVGFLILLLGGRFSSSFATTTFRQSHGSGP
jgi:hypothetical protein